MAITVNTRKPISNGNRRGYVYDIASFADGDILTTPLRRVKEVEIQCIDASIAAADAFSAQNSEVDTALSANQVKLQLIGTTRRLQLTVLGY